MRGRAVHLAFNNLGIDDLAAVVNDGVIEDVRDVGGGVDLNHDNVKLSCISERERAVLAGDVGNLEGRAPSVAAVQSDVAQLGRHHGSIHVGEIGEPDIRDGLVTSLHTYFAALLADAKFQIFFFGL